MKLMIGWKGSARRKGRQLRRFVVSMVLLATLGMVLPPGWSVVFAVEREDAALGAQRAPVDLEEIERSLNQTFRNARAALKNISRTSFDVRAVVTDVGREADALFAWVRDNTSLVPYRGALRGPAPRSRRGVPQAPPGGAGFR